MNGILYSIARSAYSTCRMLTPTGYPPPLQHSSRHVERTQHAFSAAATLRHWTGAPALTLSKSSLKHRKRLVVLTPVLDAN